MSLNIIRYVTGLFSEHIFYLRFETQGKDFIEIGEINQSDSKV